MTELDKWKNEARELNAEIEKWRKENETMTELVDEMDAEIDMLRKALGTAGLTINTQSAEIERLKAESAELRREIGGFPHLSDMRQCMVDAADRIEFLEKVAEQAADIGCIRLEERVIGQFDIYVYRDDIGESALSHPELAAWLKEKENG